MRGIEHMTTHKIYNPAHKLILETRNQFLPTLTFIKPRDWMDSGMKMILVESAIVGNSCW